MTQYLKGFFIMNLKEIGLKIKSIRIEKLSLSQEEFGTKIGYDRAFISRIEAGKQNLTIETLNKVCAGLGVDIKTIFNEHNSGYGLNVLDLFCGAGGLSYGFKLAGCNIVGGVEWDEDALNTHSVNFKSEFEFCGDIKNITNQMIVDKLMGVDVIIGGPPCQGFSAANRYEKETDDPRNKLFFEYLRFVEVIKPKAFVIENVRQILTKDNGYAKDRIIEITKKLGYNTKVQVLLASDYGVPQDRKRAVFVGIRNDYKKAFNFDKLTKINKKFTVYDAIGDICYPEKKVSNEFLKFARDTNMPLRNHEPKFPNKKVQERISYVPQGGNWENVPPHLWDTQRDNRHSSAYKRLSFNEPSITIDTGHMNYFHPIFNRVPTVRESARLQSFPDSFVFCGSQGSQYKQVGNAVPPLMSKAIAQELIRELEDKR